MSACDRKVSERKHKRSALCRFDIYPPQLSADRLVRRIVSVDFFYGHLPELHSHQTNGLLGNGVLHLVEKHRRTTV